MLIWLIGGPVLAAMIAFAVPSNRWRPWVVPLGALLHLALTCYCANQVDISAFHNWLRLDPLGRVFLVFVSVFFFICALYAPGYLAHESERSNRVLCACLLLALSAMTLVTLSHHLGLMWIAVEATTLSTAPCIYFNHNARSLEATWKYLLICSVGLALALFGSFCLAYASLFAGEPSTLLFDDLVREATHLSVPWLHVAFIVTFVGYGTKMGLAPMHTWLPDAHGESPALVSALLSGALLNVAFLAILRMYHICAAAGEGPFARRIMLGMGLASMGLTAVSMSRQRDIKRIIAYSSIEHMGMLMFGMGVGGVAVFGALLHMIHNGLTKGWLFLSAGNVYYVYGTKDTGKIRGMLRRVPWSGWMLLVGVFAITGSPPFGPFVSEFQILSTTFKTGHLSAGLLFLVLLLLVFFGMAGIVIQCSLGPCPEPSEDTGRHENVAMVLPVLFYMGLILLLGVYTPPFLQQWINEAVAFLQTAASSVRLLPQ